MTKKLFLLFCVLVASANLLAGSQTEKQARHPLLESETVVWVGLDYSLVRMYGTADFKNPDNIFPHCLDSWNALFLRERIKTIGSALRKNVEVDAEHISDRNKLARKEQVIRQDGHLVKDTHITAQDIAEAVRSYKLSEPSGLGLVFIVDRLVRREARGAVYLVLFDISNREVIATERVIAHANGVGFRNYWFGVVKNAESGLQKLR